MRHFIDDNDIVVQYDLNYNLINLEYPVKVRFIKEQKKSLLHNKRILAFDMETYFEMVGGLKKSKAYSCGFYDGKQKFKYYISDFQCAEDMIKKCFEDMMCGKYHNYNIYCHNFARFDINFIFIILAKIYKISNLVSKENDKISFSITSKNKIGKVYPKLTFKDSYCLLPSSLDDLGDAFEVEVRKGIFPYSFVNAKTIDYIGCVPDINLFNENIKETRNKMSIKEYNKLLSINPN